MRTDQAFVSARSAARTAFLAASRAPSARIFGQSVLCFAQGEKLMPVGMFRSEEGWVQVDYGTGNIPIPRSKYEENKYKPDFDKLPSEAEYWAAEKKKDDAKGS
jgi:hypothetical protein